MGLLTREEAGQEAVQPLALLGCEGGCLGKPKRETVTPTMFDVLFGRGKVKDHPGNLQLHRLIDARRTRYELSEKWEKTGEIVSSRFS